MEVSILEGSIKPSTIELELRPECKSAPKDTKKKTTANNKGTQQWLRSTPYKLINVPNVNRLAEKYLKATNADTVNKTLQALEVIEIVLKQMGSRTITQEERTRAIDGTQTLAETIEVPTKKIKDLKQGPKANDGLEEEQQDQADEDIESGESRGKKVMEPGTPTPSYAEKTASEIFKFTPTASSARINVPQRLTIMRNTEFLLKEIIKPREEHRAARNDNTNTEDKELPKAFRRLAEKAGYAPRSNMRASVTRTYAEVAGPSYETVVKAAKGDTPAE